MSIGGVILLAVLAGIGGWYVYQHRLASQDGNGGASRRAGYLEQQRWRK